ncbi:shikimate kinase [Nostoc sp. FACHB-892]|uniref:shikimate kinase n=1 Tax=Nostoc sp. FACHB-892 TaxID=2692843 RepID=UPI0016846606|nr:shikimate kinase [Nostoc sp. FACHB-892]MBD2726356.1 shikimate kinase [Nostoc sp. FACHB-892]
MKTLFILIGPKGAGKTHIGTVVDAHTGIKFLSVEPIWIDHLQTKDRDGWDILEEEIDRLFRSNNKVMIESLGAGEDFAKFYQSLKNKYHIKFIKVEYALDKCLERVITRDSTVHIPISADKVQEYNKIAAQVSYNWDLVIDNNSPASDLEIIQAIQAIE